MQIKKKIFLFLFIVSINAFVAQVNAFVFENAKFGLNPPDLLRLEKAKVKFEQNLYLEALPIFDSIHDNNKNQPYINYLLGICYSYDVDNCFKAIGYILSLRNDAYTIEGYNYNLGFAFEKNDSIDPALENYKKALSIEEKKTIKQTKLIRDINFRIARCEKINENKFKENNVSVKNLGKPINTGSSEYCPLIPSDERFMIFTYRGPLSKGGKQVVKGDKISNTEDVELFYEDIFISKKINDTAWSAPVPIDNLNTNLHDAAVSVNFDGTQMFIYKNTGGGNGDLYMSRLIGNKWSNPIYQVGINTRSWEGSACFIPNKNKIIFASEKPDGLGKRDLYEAEKLKDNNWGNIKNLGPVINTKYDEDAPFVTADGKTLFFSSNNGNSIGGYDVFRSDLKKGKWQKPYNLGKPINTKDEDKFYTVRGDGKKAYYSSFKQGGKGQQDIYIVEPGMPGKPISLLQVDGLVMIDGKPVQADIEITSILKNRKFKTNMNSNALNGNFLANLPVDDEYEIVIKVDQFPQQVVELNTVGIDSFMVINVYADFTSPEYDKKISELNLSIDEKNKKLFDKFDKKSYAGKFGDNKVDGLFYKVQIGAYKLYENFNYNNVIGMPKIIRQTDDDYITRFSMGNFETFNEAQALLEKVLVNNLKDAFIYSVYKGEKKFLHQLLEEKIVK
ncbi:MAG: PD40 domain-containing protein [Bacteroidia bacterium]|nr:PD40 domain-containing protein [Bacteroidia bacterium]